MYSFWSITIFVSFVVFEQTYSIGLVVTYTVTTFRGSVSGCGGGKVVVFPIFGMILVSGLTFISIHVSVL